MPTPNTKPSICHHQSPQHHQHQPRTLDPPDSSLLTPIHIAPAIPRVSTTHLISTCDHALARPPTKFPRPFPEPLHRDATRQVGHDSNDNAACIKRSRPPRDRRTCWRATHGRSRVLSDASPAGGPRTHGESGTRPRSSCCAHVTCLTASKDRDLGQVGAGSAGSAGGVGGAGAGRCRGPSGGQPARASSWPMSMSSAARRWRSWSSMVPVSVIARDRGTRRT
ncbi:hypothetical protein QBC39DRAFT_396489 [Podospora conica]|nr:hypothetical protein QBC39DRAFT_396489 [Schizothecium conicum]